MRQGKTFKQCEKIAQEIIETMYHVAFINNEEIEIHKRISRKKAL